MNIMLEYYQRIKNPRNVNGEIIHVNYDVKKR